MIIETLWLFTFILILVWHYFLVGISPGCQEVHLWYW